MRLLVLALLPATLLGGPPDRHAPVEVDFTRDVRPILSAHCFACHGPDEASREADLNLTHREGALDVIEPGDRDSSELWVRINDSEDPMPPIDEHNALSAEQVETLGAWIDQGASYAPHWAYVAPRATKAPERTTNDVIDAYLLARLDQEGLAPSGEADPITLVRRLHLDLTGVPPSLETVDAFSADPSDEAWSVLVDRLLADERFGERFATVWLDLVRYADTVGYHGDQTHNVWPYRDWVIDALNRNLPFDEFSTKQLAGDLLEEPTTEDLIASTYNRLLQTTHEGGLQLKEYRAIYMADRVRNASAVWLGGTLGCAECHDHKYDPYTAKDFYAFGAFFADIDEEEHLRNPYGGLNSLPTPRRPELSLPREGQAEALADAEKVLATELAKLKAVEAEHGKKSEQYKTARKPYDRANRRVRDLRRAIPSTLYTRTLDEPRTVRVLPRGNWLDESGEIVEPAVPTFLGDVGVDGRANRLDLARWLFRPESEGGVGAATARVFVNRIWAQLFGQGLCPSLEDFGGQGRPPVHPELLDRLALDFVASGWDLKALLRRLVHTEAYRRSSIPEAEVAEKDPENLLFARQSRGRRSAEMVRDTILWTAGLLVEERGGRPVKPAQPEGYYRHLNFPPRKYRPDTDDQQWRRSVYVHWQRQFLHPMLRAFDAPVREACTAQRTISTTPTQALVLLNDPVLVEAARAFAARILTEAGEDEGERLAYAFRLSTSRLPDMAEAAALIGLLTTSRKSLAADPEAATALAGSRLPAEQAAWVQVARALLNLHETTSRD